MNEDQSSYTKAALEVLTASLAEPKLDFAQQVLRQRLEDADDQYSEVVRLFTGMQNIATVLLTLLAEASGLQREQLLADLGHWAETA